MTVRLGRPHRLRVDVTVALELHLLKIARRQAPELLHHVDHGIGAELGQLAPPVVVPQHSLRLPDGLHEALGIVHPYAFGAAHGNGLEVLRAHDGADAGAAGGPVQVVDDAGKAHTALAGDADGGHLQQGASMVVLQPRLGVPHGAAPDLVRRQNAHVVVGDVQVDGMRRPALDDQQVVTGKLELRAELAAGVGAGDGAGERALGDHGVAPAGRGHGPGQRAGGEDEHVLRPHGVGAGVHALPEVLGGETALAEVVLCPRHVERLDVGRAPGQVHSKNISLPSHDVTPKVGAQAEA